MLQYLSNLYPEVTYYNYNKKRYIVIYYIELKK